MPSVLLPVEVGLGALELKEVSIFLSIPGDVWDVSVRVVERGVLVCFDLLILRFIGCLLGEVGDVVALA